MEHRIIDLRDPDNYISWQEYDRFVEEAKRINKRREAAKKGWETRRNKKKNGL